MYCSKCGSEVNDLQAYCGKCGNELGNGGSSQTAAPQLMIHQKNSGIAAILSFLVPGLGQLYDGRIARGLGLMALCILTAFIGSMAVLSASETYYDFYNGHYVSSYQNGLVAVGVVMTVICIILWIWNVFDAHRSANRYNDHLMLHGKRPW